MSILGIYDMAFESSCRNLLNLFMLWKFYSGNIFMSQENLGQHIGVARNTVCEIVSRLEEKHFLEIHKSRRNGSFFECCEYVLLR